MCGVDGFGYAKLGWGRLVRDDEQKALWRFYSHIGCLASGLEKRLH